MAPQQTGPTNLPPRPPEGEVLATMREDGSRRWLRPKPSPGKFWKKRAVVAWVLMALFTLTPWIRVGGQPLFLFDITARRFIVFGTTFQADETLPLAFLGLSIVLTIFLLSALLGRVWCGWACPQTVYLEFLYRPIERLFEGKHYKSPTRHKLPKWRLIAKYAVFLVLSLHLANTFLSWFVGTDKLIEWTRQSPLDHPVPFLVVLVTTGLMMWDFAFWREQMCTLACPYARLQSVLLDKNSLVVGYDHARGEPRGNARKLAKEGVQAGDCVDCGLCVTTCPTGIDIRKGLQLECIACTQCVDACDEVMEKVGREKGLIRYSSQNELEGKKNRLIRPRVLIYPVILAISLGLLIYSVGSRRDAEIQFQRVRGQAPYDTMDNGEIRNLVQLHIVNRTDQEATYEIRLVGPGRADTSQFPLTLGPQGSKDVYLNIFMPPSAFENGTKHIEMELLTQDETGSRVLDTAERKLLGPLFTE